MQREINSRTVVLRGSMLPDSCIFVSFTTLIDEVKLHLLMKLLDPNAISCAVLEVG